MVDTMLIIASIFTLATSTVGTVIIIKTVIEGI